MRLIDAPNGVLKLQENGELILKTEYMTKVENTYVPDCYILRTGEKLYLGHDVIEYCITPVEVCGNVIGSVKGNGKWINKYLEDGNYFSLVFSCSKCGRTVNNRTDFCPHCGTEMMK